MPGKRLTKSKRIYPRLIITLNSANCNLITHILTLNTNGDPTVSCQIGEERQKGRVNSTRNSSTKLTVVKTRCHFENERSLNVSVDRTQKIIGIQHVLVKTVGRLTGNQILRMHLNSHRVIITNYAFCTTVNARTVVLSRLLIEITCQRICAPVVEKLWGIWRKRNDSSKFLAGIPFNENLHLHLSGQVSISCDLAN